MSKKLHSIIKHALTLSPQAGCEHVRSEFIKKNIDILIQDENFRVHDDRGEGVLYKSRELTRFEKTERLCASVDRKNLDREVGLSYALFNGRKKQMNDDQLISYESPFLRKCTRNKSPEADSVSCDLVAYNATEKTLVAVEVKINPDNEDTLLDHGFLQSLTYGHILHHILKTDKDGLQKQVKTCMEMWCEQKCENTPEIESVGFVLAAPLDYFCRSLELLQLRSWWINEATCLDDARFLGFWVLEEPKSTEIGSKRERKNGNIYSFPLTECNVRICSNVQELIAYCERSNN